MPLHLCIFICTPAHPCMPGRLLQLVLWCCWLTPCSSFCCCSQREERVAQASGITKEALADMIDRLVQVGGPCRWAGLGRAGLGWALTLH